MRLPSVLLLALLLVGQLPTVAFSAVSHSSPAVSLLGQAEQSEVHGGICTNCPPKDDPDPSDAPPIAIGSPYWDSGPSRLLSQTRPPYLVIWGYSNASSTTPVTVRYSVTTTNTLNWSISGGLPAAIVNAQLGRNHSTSETWDMSARVAPRTRFELTERTVREQREYMYTQYQDYSDGTRAARNSASAVATRTWTEHLSRTHGL